MRRLNRSVGTGSRCRRRGSSTVSTGRCGTGRLVQVRRPTFTNSDRGGWWYHFVSGGGGSDNTITNATTHTRTKSVVRSSQGCNTRRIQE